MSGFLTDYSARRTPEAAGISAQIMQTFGPTEANVLNDLARNFAVCDQWYAPGTDADLAQSRLCLTPAPPTGISTMTTTSPMTFPMIFNVLESQGKSWGVFHDTTLIPSLDIGAVLSLADPGSCRENSALPNLQRTHARLLRRQRCSAKVAPVFIRGTALYARARVVHDRFSGGLSSAA